MTRPKTLTGIFGRVSSKCVNLVYAGSPMFLQNSDIVKYIRILFSHLHNILDTAEFPNVSIILIKIFKDIVAVASKDTIFVNNLFMFQPFFHNLPHLVIMKCKPFFPLACIIQHPLES